MTWEAVVAEAEVLRNDLAQARELQATLGGFAVQIAKHQARDDG